MFRSRIREIALIFILAYGVAWSLKGITLATTSKQIGPVRVGEIFPIVEARLSGDRYLVLVTSDKCPYSRASLEFHRRLIDMAHKLHVPLLVLADTKSSIPHEIPAILDGADRVMKTNLALLRVPGTPTVLLIEHGRVTGSWVGRINTEQEEGLMARLDGSFHTLTLVSDHTRVLRLKPDELTARLRESHVLDIRSRDDFRDGHLEGAANLPADELGARMQIELHEDGDSLVIDCQALEMGVCQGAAKLLEWGGIKQVWLLDAGALGSACSMSPIETGS